MVPDSEESRLARLEQRVNYVEHQVEVQAPTAAALGIQTVRIDNLISDVEQMEREARSNHKEIGARLEEMKRESADERRTLHKKIDDLVDRIADERRQAKVAIITSSGVVGAALVGAIGAILLGGGH